MDRTSCRESSTAVATVTIVPSASVVAPSQEGPAKPTPVAAHSDLDPVAGATAATPQSNSEEFLPSVDLPPLDEDPEALDAEVIDCTADNEEADSGLEDDDGDFDDEEDFNDDNDDDGDDIDDDDDDDNDGNDDDGEDDDGDNQMVGLAVVLVIATAVQVRSELIYFHNISL